jgi:hypothetical protein
MAFAIFYNREDATRIAAEFTRSDLPPADRNFAMSCWNAGLSQWNVENPDTRPDEPPTDANVIVIDGKHQGQTITLQQFRDFLYRYSAASGASYLSALADDMGRKSGAEEPWPRI